jgi:hypothetical protein
MALSITKNIQILGGIDLSSFYVRFEYRINESGVLIQVYPSYYVSKNSFQTLGDPAKIKPQLPDYYAISYNRTIDGVDVLSFIHNHIKSILSTAITQTVQQLDPSTGEYVPVEVEIVPAFASSSSISIVDLD